MNKDLLQEKLGLFDGLLNAVVNTKQKITRRKAEKAYKALVTALENHHAIREKALAAQEDLLTSQINEFKGTRFENTPSVKKLVELLAKTKELKVHAIKEKNLFNEVKDMAYDFVFAPDATKMDAIQQKDKIAELSQKMKNTFMAPLNKEEAQDEVVNQVVDSAEQNVQKTEPAKSDATVPTTEPETTATTKVDKPVDTPQSIEPETTATTKVDNESRVTEVVNKPVEQITPQEAKEVVQEIPKDKEETPVEEVAKEKSVEVLYNQYKGEGKFKIFVKWLNAYLESIDKLIEIEDKPGVDPNLIKSYKDLAVKAGKTIEEYNKNAFDKSFENLSLEDFGIVIDLFKKEFPDVKISTPLRFKKKSAKKVSKAEVKKVVEPINKEVAPSNSETTIPSSSEETPSTPVEKTEEQKVDEIINDPVLGSKLQNEEAKKDFESLISNSNEVNFLINKLQKKLPESVKTEYMNQLKIYKNNFNRLVNILQIPTDKVDLVIKAFQKVHKVDA